MSFDMLHLPCDETEVPLLLSSSLDIPNFEVAIS